MFSFGARQKKIADQKSVLEGFLRFVKSNPPQTENFLDSLSHFAKIFNLSCASVYLYDRKTGFFLLKKWVGDKPTRFSIAGNYEFLDYLKIKSVTVSRAEFEKKSSHEIREPALFYFQQTLANIACPMLSESQWLGVINVKIGDSERVSGDYFVNYLELYADFVSRWIIHQELVTENRKLSEITHVKNELLANVTHELKTPLNGILGISEALLDDPQISAETKPHVGLIKKSAEELNKTVNNLLELVTIEAKRNQKSREKIKIHQLVNEVAAIYHETCLKKGIELSVTEASATPLYVFAHPDQIRTVLMNLIGNAVKFTEKGNVKIEVAKNGEMVRVGVLDTGIGIDEDKLHLIFEEFYQASGSHTRLYGGTGLGLAIVKKIVSLHSGRVWVDSNIGAGSRFYFTLPVYPV